MPIDVGSKQDNQSSLEALDDDDIQEIEKIQQMLNPNEEVLVVARQSRIRPGGSAVTPNIIYATNMRIIIRDPYMLGIKENIVDIPYDVITSVKLEKGLLSSTIRFEAPALVGSKRLGMIEGIISGENDHEGVIEAIPKRKAEDLVEVIRAGIHRPEYSQSELKSDIGTQSTSVADELTKIAKLKEQRALTEEEFSKLKKDILDGNE